MKNLSSWKRQAEQADPELPRPDLLQGERGRNWTIKDSDDGLTTMLDPSDKRMEAPGTRGQCDLCGQQHAASIRYHELLHAKLSPEGEVRQSYTVNGETRYVQNQYIHLSEETRIDTIAKWNWHYDRIVGDEADYQPVCPIAFRSAELKLMRQKKWRDLIELSFTAATLGLTPLIYDEETLTNEYADRLWSVLSPEQRKGLGSARGSGRRPDGWTGTELVRMIIGNNDAAFRTQAIMGTLGKKNVAAMAVLAEMMASVRMRSDAGYLLSNPYQDLANKGVDIENVSWSTVLKIGKELQERFIAWDDSMKQAKKDLQQQLTDAHDSMRKGDHDFGQVQLFNAQANMDKNNTLDSIKHAITKSRREDTISGRAEKFIKSTQTVKSGGVGKTTIDTKDRSGFRTKATVFNTPENPGDMPVEWGQMQILTPPLTKKFPEHKLQKSRSNARPEGDIPRNMHRFMTDQQIFSSKRRVYGATLLVDDSGSMGFTHDQLEKILELAPASTVATYSGKGYEGHLKIVAHNGKRVGASEELGTPFGGNEIDMPALDWLAHQPWPRVWISDGQVVSPSHGFTPRVVKECMDFCDEAGIQLVNDAEAARAYINGNMRAKLPKNTRWKRTMKPKRGALKA